MLSDSEKAEKGKLTTELNDSNRLVSLMQKVIDANSDYEIISGKTSFRGTGLFEGLGSNSDLRKIMDISREYEDIIVVSLHCNNMPTTTTKNGLEIYYGTNNAIYKNELNLFLSDPNKNIFNPSYQFYNDSARLYFAQSVRDRILTETNLGLAVIDNGDDIDGLKESSTYITRETNIAGIQIELGYLSNNDDRTFLTEPTGQKRVAHGIALGIYDYFCKKLP
jgi:N-acetylmuramoyl-L-alanine amidase